MLQLGLSLGRGAKRSLRYRRKSMPASRCRKPTIFILVLFSIHPVSVIATKCSLSIVGTTERVCLIKGTTESVMSMLYFIMEKIRDKPDPNAKPAMDFDSKTPAERDKQVKILVPNSTAGLCLTEHHTRKPVTIFSPPQE